MITTQFTPPKKPVVSIDATCFLFNSPHKGGSVAGMIMGIVKNAPEIDPTNVLATLSESSEIVDEAGNIIEQIHDPLISFYIANSFFYLYFFLIVFFF